MRSYADLKDVSNDVRDEIKKLQENLFELIKTDDCEEFKKIASILFAKINTLDDKNKVYNEALKLALEFKSDFIIRHVIREADLVVSYEDVKKYYLQPIKENNYSVHENDKFFQVFLDFDFETVKVVLESNLKESMRSLILTDRDLKKRSEEISLIFERAAILFCEKGSRELSQIKKTFSNSIKDFLKRKVAWYSNFKEEDFVEKNLIFQEIRELNLAFKLLKHFNLLRGDNELNGYCDELATYINYIQNAMLTNLKKLLTDTFKSSSYSLVNFYYHLDATLWREISDKFSEMEKGSEKLPPLSPMLQVYAMVDFLCDKYNSIKEKNPKLAATINGVLLKLEKNFTIDNVIVNEDKSISYAPGWYMREVKDFLQTTGLDNGIRFDDYKAAGLKVGR